MKIGIIGSGKLATVLAATCIQEKMQLEFIHSKTKSHAIEFANKFGTRCIDAIQDIPHHLDYYLVCVNDDAIGKVAQLAPKLNGTIIHFSGSQTIELLSNHSQYGVIWPIQSFSNGTFNSLKKIPLLIEANSETTLEKIKKIAELLSESVLQVNENERKLYHLAATFVNNFSNHMCTQAAFLLNKEKLHFNLLLPILHETLRKIEMLSPLETQTGPAIRHDLKTIETHLDLLKDEPNAKEIYQVITRSIQQIHG